MATNTSLQQLADKYYVDDIHYYNANREIILSNVPEYIGWQVPTDHPINDVLNDTGDFLIEDIRKDTEGNDFFKYAYLRQKDNYFLQIGLLADDVHQILQSFELEGVIDDIILSTDVSHISFISNDSHIIASSIESIVGTKYHSTKNPTGLTKVNDTRAFHINVPVFEGERKIGTLSIYWPLSKVRKNISSIVITGIVLFFIVFGISSLILIYAYKLNKKNTRIAYYDDLTNIPNKLFLTKVLDEHLKNSHDRVALLLINCSNFKLINTTYGFEYGDLLLKRIATRLQKSLKPDEQLYHFTADRFAIIVKDYASKADLYLKANRMLSIFNNLLSNEQDRESLTAQIGIVEITEKHESADSILKEASLALTHHQDQTSIYFYQDDLARVIRREEIILQTLRRVIRREDTQSFFLYFQPKIHLERKNIVGFEALARLNSDSLDPSFVSPTEFISIAEKNYIIYDLGLIIIEHACHFHYQLVERGYAEARVAINISGLQLLRDEFEEDLIKIIATTGANPNYIVLEITESVLINNFERINDKLERLKSFGLSIDLDDFGTGFSSFSSIAELNIDRVKLDQTFINNITRIDDSTALASNLIAMCHKVGLEVIAEGVENEAQLGYLERHKCDIIQGYFFSKPLSVEDALIYIDRN
ncbi:bifunctional diguanylate cyclase/phosphodiesterase [Halolactibacillus sp. JCM 19043]|uniref:putative bifunctional diguanylate cyclase/phosphodiesterase n=1 Tax=Halolactibacillus sp. JCM 19043 TaxID=1460638 RepID=UPI000781204D|nr:phosphodiesterase [Halolactibacillus sp. JCM 19043]